MTAVEVRHRIATINEDAATFYRAQLLAPQNTCPRSYLTERGFAQLLGDTEWTVGYAPGSWTSLHDHLAGAGYSDELMLEAGLTSISRRGNSIDRFRNRLTFGIRDDGNSLVGFTARAAPTAPEGTPKYLNTPRTSAYDKSSSLFGLGETTALPDAHAVVVTEGPLDAIAVGLAGGARWAALALCGTSLTLAHGSLIARLDLPVTLALDDDAAGHRALLSAVMSLTPHVGEPGAAQLLHGHDPAGLFSGHGVNSLRAAIEDPPPATDVVLTRLLHRWGDPGDNVERTLLCLREAAQTLVRLGVPDLARQAARLSKSLALEPSTVTGELIVAATARQREPNPRRADASQLLHQRAGEIAPLQSAP